MTHNDIISAAYKAGIAPAGTSGYVIFNNELEHFANIIADTVRERCALLCERDDRYRGSHFAQLIRYDKTNT